MANYLPVLLVSVTTNSIPDDSSLSTQPRAQVDYLSHEWQEEDVWRSWRNMTRQKNEIANGIRLENASWRTWWKQRNKLKTITPETLNWLKDSDVTWLYGPFHSAVDWAPPPKPAPVPDSVHTDPASAHDRLDLSTPSSHHRVHTPTSASSNRPSHAPSKPILKYRSISELLLNRDSGDLPTSPVFSPAESEEEDEGVEDTLDAITFGNLSRRPSLLHTKSDTHITRWGPSRAFRKDSPPRIDPPGHTPYDHTNSTNIDAFFEQQPVSAAGSDSTASGSSGERKKKHISFNTFVEQCIAIEKPKKSGINIPGFGGSSAMWATGSDEDEDDDEAGTRGRCLICYEEDEEDTNSLEDDYTPWDHNLTGSAIGSDSDSVFDDIEEQDDDEDDDGVIEIRRPASHRHTQMPGKKRPPRSKSNTSSSSSASTSTASTTSSNTTTSSASSASADLQRRSSASSRNRRSSSSTYRPSKRPPPLIRTASDNVQHVTIAPIAPTILKTGAWSEGFGDEGGQSDDGFGWGKWGDSGKEKGKGKNNRYSSRRGGGENREEREGSDGTPVELVYVPPFGSNYSLSIGTDEDEGDEYEEEYIEKTAPILGGGEDLVVQRETREVFHHRPGFGDYPDTTPTPIAVARTPPLSRQGSVSEGNGNLTPGPTSAPIPVPTVIVPGGAMMEEEDAYQFFGPGADLGLGDEYSGYAGRGGEREGAYAKRSGSSGSLNGIGGVEKEREGRSRSRSRTPSPAIISPTPPPSSSKTPVSKPVGAVDVPNHHRKRSCSVSPSSTTTLLSPPARGRSFQDLPSQGRGRSSTRTPSSSSSLSDRGASFSSTSPIGSLSPDAIGSAYAGGRVDREREREKSEKRGREVGRDRERGRDRTGKRLSVSVSPEAPVPFGSVGTGEGSLGVVADRVETLNEQEREQQQLQHLAVPSAMASSFSSSSSVSSASSGNTVIPEGKPGPSSISSCSSSSTATPIPISEDERLRLREEEFLRRAEEEHQHWVEEDKQRRIHPTPSNSPVLTMRPQPPSNASSDATPNTKPVNTTSTATPTLSSQPSPPPKLNIKSPLLVPTPPLPVQPSTSYNTPPAERMSITLPGSSAVTTQSSSSQSPQSPTGKAPSSPTMKDGRIMGKAVGMVSSAGAYLGLWQHYGGSS
ncbi:hypothetical protein BDQ12DRAFT_664992 [Crucibulum laeve]|uniref:Nitrogen regulatory protein areA GATA-like domain-containing protein n=1 Tax=Crucibulum laeve TaxID=68775 RepID=A0A5C3M2Y9_9AGAR|nr:hypothetical protein BDQ12DRAFT_664992 [Crucibulum laeve]